MRSWLDANINMSLNVRLLNVWLIVRLNGRLNEKLNVLKCEAEM